MKTQLILTKAYEIQPGEIVHLTDPQPVGEDDLKDCEAIGKYDSTICVDFGTSDWMHAGKVFSGTCIRHLKPRVTPAGYVQVRFQNRFWYAVPTMITFISKDGTRHAHTSWKAAYIECDKEAHATPSKAAVRRAF